MKKIFFLFLLIFMTSCHANEPTSICGDENNLCFEVIGTEQFYSAVWNSDSIGYKVFATNIYIADTHYVEVRLFNQPIVQSTLFSSMLMMGDGIVKYRINSYWLFVSAGNIKIENIYGDRITGTFEAYMSDSTQEYQIKSGHLDAIPHE